MFERLTFTVSLLCLPAGTIIYQIFTTNFKNKLARLVEKKKEMICQKGQLKSGKGAAI